MLCRSRPGEVELERIARLLRGLGARRRELEALRRWPAPDDSRPFANECEPLWVWTAGPHVVALQLALSLTHPGQPPGFWHPTRYGRVGRETAVAVSAFQRREGLPTTGVAGRDTLCALRRRRLGPLRTLLRAEPPCPLGVRLAGPRGLFVDIPKVASSSLKRTLGNALGLPPVPRVHADERLPRAGWSDFERGAYDSWFTFAFVRNPWDRLVSCYKNKLATATSGPRVVDGARRSFLRLYPLGLRAGMSFEEFARFVAICPESEADPHFRSQHCFLPMRDGAPRLDFVGRFERLAEDWEMVRKRLGLRERLPHLNRERRASYRAFYTPALAALVGKRYARDIALFGFRFDG